MYIKFAKVHKKAKAPERANPSDAGLDVFYCPKEEHVEFRRVYPGTSARFNTGLKFEVPHGYMLQAMNRSSVAAKRNLTVGAHVIDSGYSGEVFIDLHNVGDKAQEIMRGDKIAQLVLMPIIAAIPEEVEESELYQNSMTISKRGEGSLGSTD